MPAANIGPMNTAIPLRDVYTVSRLNTEVKMVLEGSFPLLWVEGEISNLSQPSSGHLYFTLKDAHASVQCALFRNRGRLLTFTPANGQQVLIRARITLYDVRGSYQLSVEHMEPAGDGLLRRRFDDLKAKLAGEGLFAEQHKRPLPPLPRRIGVITSPSGAAIRDVLTVLGRRFPAIPVRVFPVPVQGADAAARIAAMIAIADRRADCDLLILTRGGGSLEDLWSFNEEIVARAIHAASIPIISAIGHEIDVTIADFVADRRAPTPSAAAEMAVPDRHEFAYRLAQLRTRLQRQLRQRHTHEATRLRHLQERMQRVHPRDRTRTASQRADELELRLRRAFRLRREQAEIRIDHLRARLQQRHPRQQIQNANTRLSALRRQLEPVLSRALARLSGRLRESRAALLAHSPDDQIALFRVRLTHLRQDLAQSRNQLLARRREALHVQVRTLHTVSPLATLERGYAIARDGEGRVLRRHDAVRPGDDIEVRLAEGSLGCTVTATRSGVAPANDGDVADSK